MDGDGSELLDGDEIGENGKVTPGWGLLRCLLR